MEKWKVFEKHIEMIENPSIRNFIKYVLERAPAYFWTMPASTSGRRHGGPNETLIDHVQGCLQLAECIIDQFKGHWSQKQNNQLLAALIFHDLFKAGNDGVEKRYTKEFVEEKGYSPEIIGTIRTHPEHPEIAYKNLISLSIDYNEYAEENGLDKIGGKNLKAIIDGVRYHYGPWTKTILSRKFSLSWPADYVVYQVHNIDYMQTMMSKIKRDK